MPRRRHLNRPAGGSNLGAIWVSSWQPNRLHMADCDYFVYDPILATEEELNTLPLCEWCADRMDRSIKREKRRLIRFIKAG